MTKLGVVLQAVREHTVHTSLDAVKARCDVPINGGAAAGASFRVDLNATAHTRMLKVVAHVVYKARENMWEVTDDLVGSAVDECGGPLIEVLGNMKPLTDGLMEEYRSKGVPFEIVFVAEDRVEGNLKTHKASRDETLPVHEEAMEMMKQLLGRGRKNVKSLGEAWRECSRSPGGERWLALSVLVLKHAVKKKFGGGASTCSCSFRLCLTFSKTLSSRLTPTPPCSRRAHSRCLH